MDIYNNNNINRCLKATEEICSSGPIARSSAFFVQYPERDSCNFMIAYLHCRSRKMTIKSCVNRTTALLCSKYFNAIASSSTVTPCIKGAFKSRKTNLKQGLFRLLYNLDNLCLECVELQLMIRKICFVQLDEDAFHFSITFDSTSTNIFSIIVLKLHTFKRRLIFYRM